MTCLLCPHATWGVDGGRNALSADLRGSHGETTDVDTPHDPEGLERR